MKFSGVAYRAHNPRWSWAPLSGEGAKLHGGRFNPPGTSALYLSLDRNTAILEASQGLALKFQPLTLVAYEVDCEDVGDLRMPADRRRLSIKPREIACPWRLLADRGEPVPTWEMMRRAITIGVAGIVVPSFAPGATATNANLVLWTWGDRPPHAVRVVDDEARLPRDASSWE